MFEVEATSNPHMGIHVEDAKLVRLQSTNKDPMIPMDDVQDNLNDVKKCQNSTNFFFLKPLIVYFQVCLSILPSHNLNDTKLCMLFWTQHRPCKAMFEHTTYPILQNSPKIQPPNDVGALTYAFSKTCSALPEPVVCI